MEDQNAVEMENGKMEENGNAPKGGSEEKLPLSDQIGMAVILVVVLAFVALFFILCFVPGPLKLKAYLLTSFIVGGAISLVLLGISAVICDVMRKKYEDTGKRAYLLPGIAAMTAVIFFSAYLLIPLFRDIPYLDDPVTMEFSTVIFTRRSSVHSPKYHMKGWDAESGKEYSFIINASVYETGKAYGYGARVSVTFLPYTEHLIEVKFLNK